MLVRLRTRKQVAPVSAPTDQSVVMWMRPSTSAVGLILRQTAMPPSCDVPIPAQLGLRYSAVSLVAVSGSDGSVYFHRRRQRRTTTSVVAAANEAGTASMNGNSAESAQGTSEEMSPA